MKSGSFILLHGDHGDQFWLETLARYTPTLASYKPFTLSCQVCRGIKNCAAGGEFDFANDQSFIWFIHLTSCVRHAQLLRREMNIFINISGKVEMVEYWVVDTYTKRYNEHKIKVSGRLVRWVDWYALSTGTLCRPSVPVAPAYQSTGTLGRLVRWGDWYAGATGTLGRGTSIESTFVLLGLVSKYFASHFVITRREGGRRS